MISRRQVEVRGRRVEYRVVGAGEPVVLVHGLAGSSLWWRPIVPALASTYRVYLIDLPGFGHMARGNSFTLADGANWLLAWMDAVQLERANLIGHSMGGHISLETAAARPSAIIRLVLVAPSGVPINRPLLGYTAPLVRSLRYSAPNFLPILAYDTLRARPWTLLRASRDIAASDISASLDRVTAPTLLIWGAGDQLVPVSSGRLLREALPHARLLVIDGAGHVPMYERPVELREAVLRFLAGEPVGQ